MNAAASFPPGFVNERLIVSSCLPTESLRGVFQMALVGPEVRAEGGYLADTERWRCVDELDGAGRNT